MSRYFLTVALWIPNSRSIARIDIPLPLAFVPLYSSLPFPNFDSKNHLILGFTVPESCRVRPSKGSPFGDWNSLISARASMGN